MSTGDTTLSALSFASYILSLHFSSQHNGKENHLVLPITKIFCFQPTVVFYFNGFFNDFQLNCVEIFLILHILLEKKLTLMNGI